MHTALEEFHLRFAYSHMYNFFLLDLVIYVYIIGRICLSRKMITLPNGLKPSSLAVANWFFIVPGRFSRFPVCFHGFSWFQIGFSWFLWFQIDFSWFFMVQGRVFMVFHGSRLVSHGSRSVFMFFSWFQVGFSWFFSRMYPPNCILAQRSSLGPSAAKKQVF